MSVPTVKDDRQTNRGARMLVDNNPAFVQKFVHKLYSMLEQESRGEKRVSWVDPGRCEQRRWPLGAFIVFDILAFQSEVLPQFFRHSNFSR